MLITSKKYLHTATSKLVLKLKKGHLGLRAQSQMQGPGLSHFLEALLSFPVTLPPWIKMGDDDNYKALDVLHQNYTVLFSLTLC